MRCPECNTRATVIDTRQRPSHVTRRHFCDACQKRFTTFEVVVETPRSCGESADGGAHGADEGIIVEGEERCLIEKWLFV